MDSYAGSYRKLGANVVALLMTPCGTPHPIAERQYEPPLFCFQSTSLVMCLGRQGLMAQVLGPCRLMQEIQLEFWVPGPVLAGASTLRGNKQMADGSQVLFLSLPILKKNQNIKVPLATIFLTLCLT